MIKTIDLKNKTLLKELYIIQKASYLVEAELINFFEIPPLKESMEELAQCGEVFLGYFENDILCGAISYTIEDEEVTICRMIVHPDHFRKGIATILVSEIIMLEGKRTINVSTGKDNIPAKQLYLKQGFRWKEDIEIVPNLYISTFVKENSHSK